MNTDLEKAQRAFNKIESIIQDSPDGLDGVQIMAVLACARAGRNSIATFWKRFLGALDTQPPKCNDEVWEKPL